MPMAKNLVSLQKYSSYFNFCICNSLNYNPIFSKGYRQCCKNCIMNKYEQIKNYKQPKIQFINDDD